MDKHSFFNFFFLANFFKGLCLGTNGEDITAVQDLLLGHALKKHSGGMQGQVKVEKGKGKT